MLWQQNLHKSCATSHISGATPNQRQTKAAFGFMFTLSTHILQLRHYLVGNLFSNEKPFNFLKLPVLPTNQTFLVPQRKSPSQNVDVDGLWAVHPCPLFGDEFKRVPEDTGPTSKGTSSKRTGFETCGPNKNDEEKKGSMITLHCMQLSFRKFSDLLYQSRHNDICGPRAKRVHWTAFKIACAFCST